VGTGFLYFYSGLTAKEYLIRYLFSDDSGFIRRLYGIASLSALVGGLAIYFFFRNRNVVLFAWLTKLPVLDYFLIPLKPSAFASFLRYNLPDMLWFLSGVLLLRCLWAGHWKEQTVYITVFYVIVLTIEISQLGDNVPGTFDPFDLLFMGITALFEGVIYNSFIKRRIK
jgi:hypothetical protein